MDPKDSTSSPCDAWAAQRGSAPTRERREQIRRNCEHLECECGAAEMLDYSELLEAELLRMTQRLQSMEARLELLESRLVRNHPVTARAPMLWSGRP